MTILAKVECHSDVFPLDLDMYFQHLPSVNHTIRVKTNDNDMSYTVERVIWEASEPTSNGYGRLASHAYPIIYVKPSGRVMRDPGTEPEVPVFYSDSD